MERNRLYYTLKHTGVMPDSHKRRHRKEIQEEEQRRDDAKNKQRSKEKLTNSLDKPNL